MTGDQEVSRWSQWSGQQLNMGMEMEKKSKSLHVYFIPAQVQGTGKWVD
jgi:hypothetical protein